MKNALHLTFLIFLAGYGLSNAQSVGINETGASPHASAMLHIHSTTKGLLIPRMTSAQRIAIPSPATGLMVYDIETQSFWFRNFFNQWVEMGLASNDFFSKSTHGIFTTETGIGVGSTPTASYHKFVATDSINNTALMALRNKHSTGKSALFLLDPNADHGGSLLFDNADRHLYIQNGQAIGGDIIFRTNQVLEADNASAEVVRIKRIGNVGIGINNPGAKLHLLNSTHTVGLRVENPFSSDAATYGILNDNNSGGAGKKYGIFNRVFGTPVTDDIYASYNHAITLGNPMDAYAGYFDVDTAGSGTHYGIYTRAKGDGNYALFSENTDDGWAGYFLGRAYFSGRVGIGIDTPEYRIHVVSTNKRSLHLETSHAASDTTYGIYNLIKPVGAGVHYGMYAKVELDPDNDEDAYGVYSTVQSEGTGIHRGVYGRGLGNDNIGVEGVSNGTGIGVKGVNTNNNGWAGYFDGDTYIQDRLEVRDKIFLKPAGNASAGEIELYDDDGDETISIRAGQSTTNGSEILMYNDVNDLTIDLDADGNGSGGELRLSDEEGDETVIIRAAQGSDNGAEMLLHNNDGELTVEIDADFNEGKGRVITSELEITGGSDLAEHFDIETNQSIIPGTLVSVDPEGNGNLIPTTKAYDARVAGVISGANGVSPGMLMGQRSTIADGDFPVALAGRVYVLADATKKPVVPGDLMTSSDIPGYAMAVRNYKKAHGAIIGKAITGLDQGTGFVLILVNLQ